MNLTVFDIDYRFDRLAHGMDGEVQPVAAPLLLDVTCAARDMIAQLVKIARDPPARFLATQLVWQIDVDWSLHE